MYLKDNNTSSVLLLSSNNGHIGKFASISSTDTLFYSHYVSIILNTYSNTSLYLLITVIAHYIIVHRDGWLLRGWEMGSHHGA